MPEKQDLTFAEVQGNVKRSLCGTLAKTFDEIAKTAMRASADFSSELADGSVLERIQNAHSVITLIIDEAMRGLGEATTAGVAFATVTTMKQYEEPGQ